MLNLCGIVATSRNFSMSGINSGPFSKWLPKHGIKMGGKNSTLSDIIKI
jgi:hypothetical protein